MRITHRAFRAIVDEVVGSLPGEFKEAMDRHAVAIVVRDDPPRDLLGDEGYGPFGAFFGPEYADLAPASAPPDAPRIELYLKTFQETCRSRPELEAEVEATILHELGHYLGFDEDYLEDV
jgi:predicted Zn-dependent protease with MMP-like domain